MAGQILILGATGNVGRPLVRQLLARGESVKAASRSGHPVDKAQPVVVDLRAPDSLLPALDGVDRLFMLQPMGTTDTLELLLPVVAAAAERRVKVVLQTAIGADADPSIPYRQVEIAVQASGVPYVIFRPNWFTDNFLTAWKAGIDAGVIAIPAGDGRSSFIDVRDIADCAVAALTSDRFDSRAFDLTGPEALGYAAAAELLSRRLGKSVRYQPISDDAFVADLVQAGVSESYARLLAIFFEPVRQGQTAVVTDAVPELSGHPARSVADWIADNAAALSA